MCIRDRSNTAYIIIKIPIIFMIPMAALNGLNSRITPQSVLIIDITIVDVYKRQSPAYQPNRLFGILLLSYGKTHLKGGFPLRCFQRLSFPNRATLRCHWRDNRYTRGLSIPVLSLSLIHI